MYIFYIAIFQARPAKLHVPTRLSNNAKITLHIIADKGACPLGKIEPNYSLYFFTNPYTKPFSLPFPKTQYLIQPAQPTKQHGFTKFTRNRSVYHPQKLRRVPRAPGNRRRVAPTSKSLPLRRGGRDVTERRQSGWGLRGLGQSPR